MFWAPGAAGKVAHDVLVSVNLLVLLKTSEFLEYL